MRVAAFALLTGDRFVGVFHCPQGVEFMFAIFTDILVNWHKAVTPASIIPKTPAFLDQGFVRKTRSHNGELTPKRWLGVL